MAARKKKEEGFLPVPIGTNAVSTERAQRREELINRDSATIGTSSGGAFLSLRDGEFHYAGNDIGDTLDVVILGARRENLYYEGAFDPDNIQSPTCFAIAEMEKDLAPPEDLGDGIQSDSGKCVDCWANMFRSDERGKGKACKNTVRLAVIPAYELASADSIKNADVVRVRVPVMSLKNYDNYTAKLTKGLGYSLTDVVTRLKLVPDAKARFKLSFEEVFEIPDQAFELLEEKRGEAEPDLDAFPPRQSDDDEEEKPRRRKAATANGDGPQRGRVAGGRKAGRKKVGRKKTAARRRQSGNDDDDY